MIKNEKLKKAKQIVDAAILFTKGNVCNEKSLLVWWEITKAAHERGFLYLGFDGDKIDLSMIAFKVPAISNHSGKNLPVKESGNELYVLGIACDTDEQLKIYRMFKWIIGYHKDIKYIGYHKLDTGKLHIREVFRRKKNVIRKLSKRR